MSPLGLRDTRGRCMVTRNYLVGTVLVALMLTVGLGNAFAAGPNFQVLHGFSLTDGGGLYASVAFDRKGNLYGTTTGGGAYGEGVVFKLKRQPTGQWPAVVLHSFQIDDNGYEPNSTPVFDAAGNFYATTIFGGANHGGTAFEMSPSPSGWTFNVIYNYCSLPDCADSVAYGGFAFDAAGNLYGAFSSVLELTPSWESGHQLCSTCSARSPTVPMAAVQWRA